MQVDFPREVRVRPDRCSPIVIVTLAASESVSLIVLPTGVRAAVVAVSVSTEARNTFGENRTPLRAGAVVSGGGGGTTAAAALPVTAEAAVSTGGAVTVDS